MANAKEAQARIKINKLLESAGWRFFDDGKGNPNIVVNGDAELIHVLDFNHQCHVKQTGSLQDQAMRREVCQVMEGGEEAFERRYQRLGREV